MTQRSPFRTVQVTPDGLVHLLQALAADQDVRLCGHGVPDGVGIAGTRWDPDALTLEVDLVHHRWPDEVPPGRPIEILFARRLGRSGTDGDWGPPEQLSVQPVHPRAQQPDTDDAF